MSETKNQSTESAESASGVFPSDTVFAAFDPSARAGDAVRRLHDAGVADRAVSVYDRESVDVFESSSGEQGVLASLAQQLSDASTYMDKYAEQLRAGAFVVAVRFEHDSERQTITSLLLGSGAKDVCYTSGWTLTAVVGP